MNDAVVMYTPEQKAAIENKGGALLVSAAAGSGKTKVLVERLITYMTDPENHCNIDDFLIITYTRAAAAELRSKILDEIGRRLALNPKSRHLRRQSVLCYKAQISTIHGFCTEILRENAHLAGLSPDFRVADENESNLIKEAVLEKVLNNRYETIEEDSDFAFLVDTMSAGRDDMKLVAIVLDAHSKLQSHPYPEKWVAAELVRIDLTSISDVSETVWGRLIMEHALQSASYWESEMTEARNKMMMHEKLFKAYGDSFAATIDSIRLFINALQIGWDLASDFSKIDFPLARISGYEEFKEIRTHCKKEMEKIRQSFLSKSSELIEDMEAVRPAIASLLNLVLEFNQAYSVEKRRRGLIDFADQEHMTVQLLLDEKTGRPTETAFEISKRYAEILVDEYQDVNEVQDLIFNAISKRGQNVFMVGDVKQSIYRFRLADPTIFLDKYRKYRDVGDPEESEGRRVILSTNFRSREGILNAVNFIFKNIMSLECGEMDYTPREYLKAGLHYPDSDSSEVEINVIDMKATEESEDEEELKKTEAEALFIAERIKDLIEKGTVSDGLGGLRPAAYGDIVILLRSVRNKAEIYAAQLSAQGIPVSNTKNENFFETIEISVMTSLLSVIDNPMQDIPLISVLRSPIYGFTADELAEIRAADPKSDFFPAMSKAAETNEKCQRFLSDLERYRDAVPEMSSDRLIWHLYNVTGILGIMGAMHGGEQRRNNLILLFEYSRRYEANGYKGLFGFITYLRHLMERGEDPGLPSGTSEQNAVRVMSIHKSKGLEFPIVILADTTKRWNQADAQNPILIHSQLGIGAKRLDLNRKIEYTTLARMAVTQKIKSETMSEEMRVLYVAMTRAREKLIITCVYPDARKEMARLMNHLSLPIHPQVLEKTRCPAEWIMLPALTRPESKCLHPDSDVEPTEGGDMRWDINFYQISEVMKPELFFSCDLPAYAEVDEKIVHELAENLNFIYPYEYAVNLPSKLTATELKGRYSDQEASEDAETFFSNEKITKPMGRPNFIVQQSKLTGAERGTALHLVMQYIDFKNCLHLEDINQEINRLVTSHMITQEQATAVPPQKILNFFKSKLGTRVLSAGKLYREFKFSLLVPAKQYFAKGGDDEILFQGVIDCCIEEEGKLTIIDYKTDYVDPTTLADKALFYKPQMDAYANAMEKITMKPVASKILYFFATDSRIEV